ncbi:PREDICTED: uncharacterized protein LOC105559561 isoform X6 [Vollenhovia emeryi]|uniref:uncharacterized protein LOC105559561 isoform X6 n=1 Tax=Vollenhovia emeryi TaxID=411798 RepID=UPI0005F3F5F4|nr:PREDICTED: uncharacterized protein LOC105559561 isoform X6 [Vollenhovia emeryi]
MIFQFFFTSFRPRSFASAVSSVTHAQQEDPPILAPRACVPRGRTDSNLARQSAGRRLARIPASYEVSLNREISAAQDGARERVRGPSSNAEIAGCEGYVVSCAAVPFVLDRPRYPHGMTEASVDAQERSLRLPCVDDADATFTNSDSGAHNPGDGAAMSAEMENADLENVLQRIFVECDASMSSTSDAVLISSIVEYIRDKMPKLPVDNLIELWKCLVAVSTNDRVNMCQFKEATKRWIANVQQSTRNNDNDARERLCPVNDADTSMNIMNMDKDVELEVREKFRKLYEENISLRDELERHEVLIDTLKQQHNATKKQLKDYIQKCQHFEKENDEQKEHLNELIKKEKSMALTLQRYTKEHQNLSEQLETVEVEVQAIPSLKTELKKIIKEKMECEEKIGKMQERFDEKEDNCRQLSITVTQLKEMNNSMKESYEYMIHDLRAKNRLLMDENTELQSLSALSMGPTPLERLSISPIMNDTDECYMHSTPYKSKETSAQDSLYTELKVLGYTAECCRHGRRDLEEELNEYDAAISEILEQLEKVIQFFVTMRGSTDDLSHFDSQDTGARAYDVLKHKAALLLYMATEEITRRSAKRDSSTQLRADPVNAASTLDQFGVGRSFQDLLHARPKAEAGLRSTASRCVNNEDDDLFARVVRTYTCAQSRYRTVEPIIEELHDIIESTLGALANRKDCPLSGSSRFRSVHTLPSSLQSLQSFTLAVENSRAPGCQDPETTDAPLARGDALMRGDRDDESASLAAEAREVISDQRDPARSEEDRSREMPKVTSVLQMNSKETSAASEKAKARAGSFQVPEASSAGTSPTPRRKISVYCRSFDVVTVQDRHEDHPGSNLEVRQSPNSPDDSPARVDGIGAAGDRDAMYPFNHDYRDAKSDSSRDSTPRKLQDGLLDDEPPIEEPTVRKVRLAPTRLKFPQDAGNEFGRIAEAPCYASPGTSNSNDISDSPLSPIGEHKEDEQASLSLAFAGERRMEAKSVAFGLKSHLNSDENASQAYAVSNHRLFPSAQADSAKIVASEDPHSQTSVRRLDSESQSRIERSVDSQMSSREDSLAVSGGEHEPAAGHRCGVDEKVANGKVGRVANAALSTSVPAVSTRVTACENVTQSDGKATCEKRLLRTTKQDIRQWLVNMNKRSHSEGENLGRLEHGCRCKVMRLKPLIPECSQSSVFPSLADIRPQRSGIANLSDSEENRENLSELELQKMYTAFSLCLCVERLTLSRRVAMSCRQRDQSEKNLACEVQRMQQDIQELAPLCTDRESVERVERVRHQLDMIVRCAHRVSCAAETLGAVHQERRVSRAILIADKYLQVLQSRCEKLISNVAETKRILLENNIMIEEISGELNDELPRIRYRSGTPANNRDRETTKFRIRTNDSQKTVRQLRFPEEGNRKTGSYRKFQQH